MTKSPSADPFVSPYDLLTPKERQDQVSEQLKRMQQQRWEQELVLKGAQAQFEVLSNANVDDKAVTQDEIDPIRATIRSAKLQILQLDELILRFRSIEVP